MHYMLLYNYSLLAFTVYKIFECGSKGKVLFLEESLVNKSFAFSAVRNLNNSTCFPSLTKGNHLLVCKKALSNYNYNLFPKM